jgi:hypothetical protein
VQHSSARRSLLKALALAPVAGLAPRAAATDYASAGEVFTAIDRLEADVAGRLRAIVARIAQAQPFVASVLADHERHRTLRARLRARLRLPAAAPTTTGAASADLGALRSAQQDLVHAHAEGLRVVGDALAVDGLARNMVDLARHLTVIDLWLEGEERDA